MKNTDLSKDSRIFILQAIEEHFAMDKRPFYFPLDSYEWKMVMNFKQHLQSTDSVEFDKEEVSAIRKFAVKQCQTCGVSKDQGHAQKYLDFINELLEHNGFRRYECLGDFLHDYHSK